MNENPQADLFMQYLPAIYRSQPELATFLRAFEAILLGGKARRDDEPAGLRESIAALPTYIVPETTPEHFLPWLASWVALSLQADLPVERKRLLIARAASLFQWRGTLRGLRELLQIVAGKWIQPATIEAAIEAEAAESMEPKITEPTLESLIVGVQAVVGATTRLGRELPYLFQVTFTLPEPKPPQSDLAAFESLLRDTIELGKPAHTYYELRFTDSAGAIYTPEPQGRMADNAASTTEQ
ncbi:MAG TPA: phage tail protein [Bryocella sp.]|nr:phage tail protein [Bryocella sp.]